MYTFAIIVCPENNMSINFLPLPCIFVKFWFLITALCNNNNQKKKKRLNSSFAGVLLCFALPYFTNLIEVSKMSWIP